MNGKKRHSVNMDRNNESTVQSLHITRKEDTNAIDKAITMNDCLENTIQPCSFGEWAPPVFNSDMQVINLDYRYYQAFSGRYFYGHTPMTDLGGGCDGWAALINPPDSGINLFVNYFSVSNNSDTYFRSEAYLNAIPQGPISISHLVENSNGAVNPAPRPHAELAFGQKDCDRSQNGISIYSIMAGAGATASAEPYGKIIIPPGKTYFILLHAPESQEKIQVEVAFGWWEERACLKPMRGDETGLDFSK